MTASVGGERVNRMVYFVEGRSLTVSGAVVKTPSAMEVDASRPLDLQVPETSSNSNESTDVLILEGIPIDEPVAQYGPFVMNTNREIEQAFDEYRR